MCEALKSVLNPNAGNNMVRCMFKIDSRLIKHCGNLSANMYL